MPNEPIIPLGIEAQLQAVTSRYGDGVTSDKPQQREVDIHLTTGKRSVDIPLINNELPGDIAPGVPFWVPIDQLEMAPAEFLLNSWYNFNDDGSKEELKQSIADQGDGIDALPILPSGKVIKVARGDKTEEKPLYLVYDRPELFYGQIALRRARIKAFFPLSSNPRDILLGALAREGQLRRDPSQIELSEAALRLSQQGVTLEKIASQLRLSEDGRKPSITTVHFMITVAKLPHSVKAMVHEKKILWTHARDIGTNFLGNDRMCEELALLVCQGRQKSVEELNDIIKRINEKKSHLILNGGAIEEVRDDAAIRLVSERSGRAPEIGGYQNTMIAKPMLIRRASSKFDIVIIPADKPEDVALAPKSFSVLTDWLSTRSGNTSYRDVEATLLGFLEAMRARAHDLGIVNNQGIIAPMVTEGPAKEKQA